MLNQSSCSNLAFTSNIPINILPAAMYIPKQRDPKHSKVLYVQTLRERFVLDHPVNRRSFKNMNVFGEGCSSIHVISFLTARVKHS